jgi:hypothetical protein
MPHFENVPQFKANYPIATTAGVHYGVNHGREKALTSQIRSRCQNAKRNEKSDILLFLKGSAVKLKSPAGAAILPCRGLPSLVPLLNFFIPAMKLERKVKSGSREIKKCGEPRGPYHHLLESGVLSSVVKAELPRLYRLYNPVQLPRTVNKAILALREAVAAQSPSSGRNPAA